jgi:small subunit ribosomal protein S3
MGQKVNPIGFRVGIVRPWESQWFSAKEYARYVHEDLAIRTYIKKKYYHAGVSSIYIERAANKAKVHIHAAKPGVILGKRAAGLEDLRINLAKITGTKEIFPKVIEVRKVETDAQLVAENIAAQLVKRVSFRRAMKKAMTQAMRSGAKGVKVMCSGRLGGSEMSRTEFYRDGRVPLHTIRADIDYGFAEAKASYGVIGVKVWIFKGEIMLGDTAVQT